MLFSLLLPLLLLLRSNFQKTCDDDQYIILCCPLGEIYLIYTRYTTFRELTYFCLLVTCCHYTDVILSFL
jgi:hypothetical protein